MKKFTFVLLFLSLCGISGVSPGFIYKASGAQGPDCFREFSSESSQRLEFYSKDRLTLRTVGVEELDAMWEIYGDPKVQEMSGDKIKRITLTRLLEEGIQSHKDFDFGDIMNLGVYLDGRLVAGAQIAITPAKPGVRELQKNNPGKWFEISFHLHPSVWGKGVATEIANATSAFVIQEMNAAGIQADCISSNRGSETVLRKVGLREVTRGAAYNGAVARSYFAATREQILAHRPELARDYRWETSGGRNSGATSADPAPVQGVGEGRLDLGPGFGVDDSIVEAFRKDVSSMGRLDRQIKNLFALYLQQDEGMSFGEIENREKGQTRKVSILVSKMLRKGLPELEEALSEDLMKKLKFVTNAHFQKSLYEAELTLTEIVYLSLNHSILMIQFWSKEDYSTYMDEVAKNQKPLGWDDTEPDGGILEGVPY